MAQILYMYIQKCTLVWHTYRTKTLMEKLQPIATAATIAVNEYDFSTFLELGRDLFCSGYTQLHALKHTLFAVPVLIFVKTDSI